jgi:hypothetical protein
LFCEEGASTAAAAAGPFEFVSEELEVGFVGIIMMMMMGMGRKKKMMIGWREMVMCVVVCVSVILFSVQQADAHGGAHHEEVAGPAAHDDASSVGLDNLQAKGLILVKICCLIIAFFAARH